MASLHFDLHMSYSYVKIPPTMDKTLFSSKTKQDPKQAPRRPVFGSFEAEAGDQQRERLKAIERVERKEVPQKVQQRKEFTVFAYTEYKEQKVAAEKIEKVRKELILAIAEMKKLGTSLPEVERVAYERIPQPGVYHLNFFEKLIMMLKVLRKNISESKNWLDAVFTKKSKRRYWNMAKGGGSKFTMSHERRLATQAG